MQYPLISEYVRAMQDPAGNLDQLAHLVPVLDDHGEPMRSSGAFAVVFKMKDESTGKEYALKCFTEEQEGRVEAYRQIADELESVDSTYVTSVKYLEKELFVDCDGDGDDHEFPVLLMDWIEGETMDHYITENLYDNYAMSMLCYRFCKMAAWLRSQPFAHGDIKPDNIMVRPDGTLTLIDYDGMFVPTMKGQTSPTIGTKDFSHPLRTKEDFDETIDDFALATIALSLKAISLSPSLFDEYGSSDRLLFSADDYRDLSQSKLLTALQPLMTDPELMKLISIFLLVMADKNINLFPKDFVHIYDDCVSSQNRKDKQNTKLKESNPKISIEETTDEFRVRYSKDGTKLICAPRNLKGEYKIREGTVYICERAFSGCDFLTNIVIPKSVIDIGKDAFSLCNMLEHIVINEGVVSIGDGAFSFCFRLVRLVLPDSVKSIGKESFYGCSRLDSIVIPEGVISIGDSSFGKCNMLQSITIPASVQVLVGNPFLGLHCKIINKSSAFCYIDKILFNSEKTKIIAHLDYESHRYVIPNGIVEIGDAAFAHCDNLKKIIIPYGVTRIGQRAFSSCVKLKDVLIPESVVYIGNAAFEYCKRLKNIILPNSVTHIGRSVFSGCKSLIRLAFPNKIISISDGLFYGCDHLSKVILTETITSIGKFAFSGCKSIKEFIIPESVIEISVGAFEDCVGLQSLVIPQSVREIPGNPFIGCNCELIVKTDSFYYYLKKLFNSNMTRIVSYIDCKSTEVAIPNGVVSIGDYSFYNCQSLQKISIPESVRYMGKSAFYGCTGLQSVVIPPKIERIECDCFRFCKNLKQISIQNEDVDVGKGAFSETGLSYERSYGLSHFGKHPFV